MQVKETNSQDSSIGVGHIFVPALPHILIDPNGDHALMGSRCSSCAAVIEGERLGCPACGERSSLEAVRLFRSGRIAAHTVVYRSYPGAKTPFVSVVVDLDGGGTIRGTLRDFDPLSELPADQRVEMIFRDSGQRNSAGRPFLCYYFVPEGSTAP